MFLVVAGEAQLSFGGAHSLAGCWKRSLPGRFRYSPQAYGSHGSAFPFVFSPVAGQVAGRHLANEMAGFSAEVAPSCIQLGAAIYPSLERVHEVWQSRLLITTSVCT